MGALDRVFRGRRGGQERPLAAIIAGLWRNGEQGARYEAGDLSTMFQDAAGTLPVYAPGSGQIDPPVGLWLDKRVGAVRGPNVVINGTFDSDTLDWSKGEGWSISGGALRKAAGSGTVYVNATQACLVVGRWYEVTLSVLSISADSADVSGTSFSAVPGSSRLRSSPGTIRFIGQATSNLLYVSARQDAAAEIDVVSAREIAGNHAYQTTTTSRPTLSARYNLLTNTSFAGAIAGTPGTAPTGWVFGFSTGEISAVTPLGPDFAIQIATSATRLIFTQQLTAAPNVAYSHWIDVLETTAITAINFIALTSPPSGATMTYWFNGELITSSTVISSPGRLEMRMTVGSAGGSYYVRFGVGCSSNTTGVATIARPDVRVTNDGVGLPPYQRVVDPNTYDTVFFPPYLRFDGVDDWLRTSDIDFSGVTALFVAAAARKLSDAARGTLCELSSSYSNPGSFALEAPGITLNSFMFAHTGATTYKTLYRQLPAPVSAVVVGVSDLPSGYVRLSAKSPGYAQMSDVTTDVGGGSYATASLFIGRRAGSSQPFNGRLYSLYIRGGSSTVAQLSAVERHMNQQARIY